MSERVQLVLEDESLSSGRGLPFEIESLSSSGVAVLAANQAPSPVDYRLLGGRLQDGGSVRFLLRQGESLESLEGHIVWLEVSDTAGRAQRVELIVNGDGPQWRKLYASLRHL